MCSSDLWSAVVLAGDASAGTRPGRRRRQPRWRGQVAEAVELGFRARGDEEEGHEHGQLRVRPQDLGHGDAEDLRAYWIGSTERDELARPSAS